MSSRWRLFRHFSSTARNRQSYVSNVGKQPIKCPSGVMLTHGPTTLLVEGPLGKTSVPLQPFVRLAFSEDRSSLDVSVETPSVKQQRAMWGTTRTLISNAIVGMSEGYRVPLFLVGVGFRAALEQDPRGGGAKRLNMKVGYSHPVFVPVPPHITAEVPLPTKIILSCNDKQQLGQFAAVVRSFRKPEPYKGKVGISCTIMLLDDLTLFVKGDLHWR